MSSFWGPAFRDGWNKLHTAQRSARAKYIVEAGLNEGHNAAEMSRELAESAAPISPEAIKQLIDLKSIGEGVAAAAGIGPQGSDLAAGRHRVAYAWQQHADKVTVTDTDVAKVRKQFPHADQVTIERIAKGRAIGERLVDKGKIEQDGKSFYLDTPDPRNSKVVEAAQVKESKGTPVTYTEWRKAFGGYASKCRAFVTFLRRTGDDKMRQDTFEQLQNLTNSFQEQADRFDVGAAKYAARS